MKMEKPTSSSSLSSASIQFHNKLPPPPPEGRQVAISQTTGKPTWLLSVLADVEERMKMITVKSNRNSAITLQDEEDNGDTFAERAEAYYKTRPQLLSLLQDLYNSYLTLSDRYIQTIAKSTTSNHSHAHPGQSSQMSIVECYSYYDQQDQYGDHEEISHQNDSDAESSLSYQQPPTSSLLAHQVVDDTTKLLNFDAIVAQIVIKNVEYDILLDEVNASERQYHESSRKIELQRSLLEVLESERLILLNENAKLGYRVGALVEENKAIASESLFMRRKAGELARCLLKMREDCRVSMLSRKIEDLQGQIYGLEKRNKEYYQQLVKREHSEQGLAQEEEQTTSISKKWNENKTWRTKNGNEVDLRVCFQMGKIKKRSGGTGAAAAEKKGSSWWGKVKNIDLFLCGLNPTSSTT